MLLDNRNEHNKEIAAESKEIRFEMKGETQICQRTVIRLIETRSKQMSLRRVL